MDAPLSVRMVRLLKWIAGVVVVVMDVGLENA